MLVLAEIDTSNISKPNNITLPKIRNTSTPPSKLID